MNLGNLPTAFSNFFFTELKGLDLRTGLFTYRQIRAATDDFSSANKIGEGGFGAVIRYIQICNSFFYRLDVF
jgi:hypothetical protein